MEKVIAVVGPTGSGKTALGRALAEKLDGVIISADSRQVYRGLDIGTNKEGKPGSWEKEPARYFGEIPQLLIDIVEPGTRFTLVNWLIETKRLIKKVIELGKVPILVGGTGLYITALLEGWQPGKENPQLRAELETKEVNELKRIAERLRIELNHSDSMNKRRLIRAIERSKTGGKIVSNAAVYDALLLQNSVSREILFQKSDERFVRILPDLIIETSKLISNGVSVEWLESIGLDYRYCVRHISGKLSETEAIEQFQRASRAYIRRQQTWWRHHQPVTSVHSLVQAISLARSFLTLTPRPKKDCP